MRMLLALGLGVSVLLLTVAADETKKVENKDLVGTWKVVKAERDGMPYKPYITQIVIKKNGELELHETSGKGRFVSLEDYKTRQGKKHKELDMGETTDDGKPIFGNTLKGGGTEYFPCTRCIYKIEKGQLTLCTQTKATNPRPTSFTTKKGDWSTLYVLMRVK
ncbi:MAG: TIGR03067 domain-containing protein [Planctomycetaceae bacterium]|nr:TIGR03067 domain-containing protein [Planctomycetaceae bacterium]